MVPYSRNIETNRTLYGKIRSTKTVIFDSVNTIVANPDFNPPVEKPDNLFGELDDDRTDAQDDEDNELYAASDASSVDVYDSAVEGLLEIADMGSLNEVPTPQTVIPAPPSKYFSKNKATNPKPPVIPSKANIPHQYGTRQRFRFDGSHPLHGTEVNHTYRCLVVTDDAEPPPIAEMSKILRIIAYDDDGCASNPFLDPNMQHFSLFQQVLRINRLSWRDDPSIHYKFQQAIRVPK